MSTGFKRVSDVLGGKRGNWVVVGLLIILIELVSLFVYATRPNTRIVNPWPMVFPIIWIDVSAFVLVRAWRSRPSGVTPRRRWVARFLGAGYFVVLGHFGGLYGWFGTGRGLFIDFQLPPGASPALLYNGHPLVLALQPYKVLGYLTLTYLVYWTILRAAGSAVSGVVGLFSCVSCSWPLIGLVASAVFGGTSAVAAVALSHDYLLSTVIFLSSIGLLYWQPSFDWAPFRSLSHR